MTYPETIVYRGVRRVKCPTSGCERPLSQMALVKISGDGHIRLLWRCVRCRKATEVVADIIDSCWASGGDLTPSLRDG